jgi:hypothetical protein
VRDGFIVDDDVTFNLVDGKILIGDISLPESQLLVRTSGENSNTVPDIQTFITMMAYQSIKDSV